MTREWYFEMCKMFHTEPDEDEIPIAREDLSYETQVVFNIYDKLPAKWEGFAGVYLGKELLLLPILFKEFNIERPIQKYAWTIIPIIDAYVAEDISRKIKAKSKQKGDLPSGRHTN